MLVVNNTEGGGACAAGEDDVGACTAWEELVVNVGAVQVTDCSTLRDTVSINYRELDLQLQTSLKLAQTSNMDLNFYYNLV